MIRYKLAKDTKYIYTEQGEKVPLSVFLRDEEVFIDLLEPMDEEGSCHLFKARIYYPNGEIITGKVLGWTVALHDKDLLFDGRFNGVK
jgi:hypothetical protein